MHFIFFGHLWLLFQKFNLLCFSTTTREKGTKWQSLISENSSLKLKCCFSKRKVLFSTFKSFGIFRPLCVDCISIKKMFHERCSRSDASCKPLFCNYLKQDFEVDVSFSLVQRNISIKEKNIAIVLIIRIFWEKSLLFASSVFIRQLERNYYVLNTIPMLLGALKIYRSQSPFTQQHALGREV